MEDQVNQSEQTDSSPAIEESTSQVEASGTGTQEGAPEIKQEDKPLPFHEHPRWKEVIEERNSFKQGMSEYKQALDRLQQQMETLKQQATTPKAIEQPKQDVFLNDLEKVNPEYAKSLKAIYEQAGKTTQLEQRIAQYEQQQLAEKAYNHFNSLLSTNKIENAVDQELYRNVVEAEVYRRESRGEKLGLKDLDGIFNQFHSKYAKAMEERERAITAKYVTAKKSDATQSPKGATGGAATSPTAKKMAAGDFSGQAKWLADQIRQMKKTI